MDLRGLRGLGAVRQVDGRGSATGQGIDRSSARDESAGDVPVIGKALEDSVDIALMLDIWEIEGVQGGLVAQPVPGQGVEDLAVPGGEDDAEFGSPAGYACASIAGRLALGFEGVDAGHMQPV